MTETVAGWDPIGGLVLGAAVSLPFSVAVFLLARQSDPADATVRVAGGAGVTALVGLAGALVVGGRSAGRLIGLLAAQIGVQLGLGILVGRWVVRRSTACDGETALVYTLAGLPLGQGIVALVVLLPNGGLRSALEAMTGPVAVVGWGLLALLLFLTPGWIGVWLYRIVGP